MELGAPPPLDVAVARRVAEREMHDVVAEGGALTCTRFNGGYVVVGTFTAPRPPGDAALVVFDDLVVEVYPSWPVAMVAERAERDFAHRLASASDTSNSGWGATVDDASAEWAAQVERDGLPGTTYDMSVLHVTQQPSTGLHALLGRQVELGGSSTAVTGLVAVVVDQAEAGGWEVRTVTGGWESHGWARGAVEVDARIVCGWLEGLDVDALTRVFTACVDWEDEYWSSVSVAVCRALAVTVAGNRPAVDFAASAAYRLATSGTWTADERAVLDATAGALLEVHQALGSTGVDGTKPCGVMLDTSQLHIASAMERERVARVLATAFVESALMATTPTLLVVDAPIGRRSDAYLGSDHVGPSVARLRIRT